MKSRKYFLTIDRHVWKDQLNIVSSKNTARKVIDAISYLGNSIEVPKDLACQWLADKVAPTYWVPNAEIYNCFACKIVLSRNIDKHHCRLVVYI